MDKITIPLEDLQIAKDGSFRIKEIDKKKINKFLVEQKHSSSNGSCENGNCEDTVNLNCEE